MTKKSVFLGGLVGTICAFLTSGLTMLTFWCGESNYTCWDKFETPSRILLTFIPLFIFSSITYFIREEVFRTWLHFTYFWIPISTIIIYLTPNSSGGFGVPSIFDQEFVSIIFSILFLIISSIIITAKYLTLKKVKK